MTSLAGAWAGSWSSLEANPERALNEPHTGVPIWQAGVADGAETCYALPEARPRPGNFLLLFSCHHHLPPICAPSRLQPRSVASS